MPEGPPLGWPHAFNLVKHAVDGAIVLRIVRTAQQAGVEFLAVDKGPGMADVAAAMRDGRSTAGTLGIGLGMVARLADTFDLHSLPGQGTVMLARFWPRDAPSRHSDISADLPESVVGGVTRPISGATECGDGWAARWDEAGTSELGPPLPDAVAEAPIRIPDSTLPGHEGPPAAGPAAALLGAGRAVLVMLCDGLGHGPMAEMAAQAAIAVLAVKLCRPATASRGFLVRSIPGRQTHGRRHVVPWRPTGRWGWRVCHEP